MNIQDIIAQAVKGTAGGVEIPSNLKEEALNGLSDSIFGSLTQTAASAGGIEQLKGILGAAGSLLGGLLGKK